MSDEQRKFPDALETQQQNPWPAAERGTSMTAPESRAERQSESELQADNTRLRAHILDICPVCRASGIDRALRTEHGERPAATPQERLDRFGLMETIAEGMKSYVLEGPAGLARRIEQFVVASDFRRAQEAKGGEGDYMKIAWLERLLFTAIKLLDPSADPQRPPARDSWLKLAKSATKHLTASSTGDADE